jgi:hypothetical protein
MFFALRINGVLKTFVPLIKGSIVGSHIMERNDVVYYEKDICR